jgi:drug/metabolite transporter (DMT)-like permease
MGKLRKRFGGRKGGIVLAALSVLCYAPAAPIGKLFFERGLIGERAFVAFLYLGSGLIMSLLFLLRPKARREAERRLGRKDAKWVAAMIVSDIAVSSTFFWGISLCEVSSAAMLAQIEIAAAALSAYLLFRERQTPKAILGMAIIALAALLLVFQNGFSGVSWGYALIALSSAAWGFEDAVTKKLADADPMETAGIKGLSSGSFSLILALALRDSFGAWYMPFLCMLIGFACYGMSLVLFMRAQRSVGATIPSAMFAGAPFLESFLGFAIFAYLPTRMFIVASLLTGTGVFMTVSGGEKPIPPVEAEEP